MKSLASLEGTRLHSRGPEPRGSTCEQHLWSRPRRSRLLDHLAPPVPPPLLTSGASSSSQHERSIMCALLAERRRGMHVRGMHVRGMHVRGMHVRGMHVRGMHVRGMHERELLLPRRRGQQKRRDNRRGGIGPRAPPPHVHVHVLDSLDVVSSRLVPRLISSHHISSHVFAPI